VPYAIDHHSQISGPFTRVAYYLELQSPGGALQYIWVSMDAFTTEIRIQGRGDYFYDVNTF